MSRRLPLAPWISTISGPLPMLSAWTRWPFTSRMRPSGGKAASARASWARASSCATTQSRASASRQARAILTANGMKIEGRCLVNLVDPVAVKQMRMAAPAVLRRARGIVTGIVIAGQGDRRAIVHVAIIFLLERVAVIFKVVEDVERAMCGILDQAGTDLVTVQKDVEIGYGFDLVAAHLGPTADRDHAIIRESAQIGRCGRHVAMAEAAESLFIEQVFLHAVQIVHHRHAAPAHTKGGMHMGPGPVEHLAKLAPVGDLVKRQML